MRRFSLMIALLSGFVALPFAAHAQDDDTDTMDPVMDGLPEGVPNEAREASAFGLETAREARELGDRDPEAGREFGRETAERAQRLGNPDD